MKKGIIILIIAAAIAIYLLRKDKKPARKTLNDYKDMFGATEAKEALLKVSAVYGKDMAADIERIMRLETAHFTSSQYQKTGTAGLTKGKWTGLPANLPTIDFTVNGKVWSYYVWNVSDFAIFLAKYIVRNNGNWARWYSTKPVSQEEYRKKVSAITNRFIV